jgi:hypothetical protein
MAQVPAYPNNPMTRMMERAAQRNAEHREVSVETGSSPAARSAAIGHEVIVAPLSEDERAELDRKAIELGIMPNDSEIEGVTSTYASAEEAARAGSAVPDPPQSRQTAREFTDVSRATARETVANDYARLPDFTKVGGIDLIRDVLYVDGMEFSVPKVDADELRLYAINIANQAIVAKLNSAVATLTGMGLISTEAKDAGADTVAGDVAATEAVQQVPGDEATQ